MKGEELSELYKSIVMKVQFLCGRALTMFMQPRLLTENISGGRLGSWSNIPARIRLWRQHLWGVMRDTRCVMRDA